MSAWGAITDPSKNIIKHTNAFMQNTFYKVCFIYIILVTSMDFKSQKHLI